MDLMEGSSLTETLDDATGLSSKSVTDWKSSSKNSELKPRITLRNEKGEIIKKADGNEAGTIWFRIQFYLLKMDKKFPPEMF